MSEVKQYIIGEQIGHSIIASEPYNRNGRMYIKVKCEDCGEEREVRTDNIGGYCKKCGYKHRTGGEKNAKDLSGQVFGYLTAIKPLDKRQNRKVVWLCECVCGNTCEVLSTNLKAGRTKSCGCQTKQMQSEARTKSNPRKGDIYRGYEIFDSYIKPDTRGHNVWYVKAKCPYCENGIIDTEATHLGSDTGVKSCGCLKTSSGEARIALLLEEAGIPFEREKTFKDCYFSQNFAKSRFDFYVDNKYLIEFDGSQHFKVSSGNSWATPENVALTKERDAYKNQWCKEHNIPLIRIPYTRYRNLCLEDLLLETTTFLVKEDENSGNNNDIT